MVYHNEGHVSEVLRTAQSEQLWNRSSNRYFPSTYCGSRHCMYVVGATFRIPSRFLFLDPQTKVSKTDNILPQGAYQKMEVLYLLWPLPSQRSLNVEM